MIIATFADDGPPKCSGLEVERYNAEKLAYTLGNRFELVKSFRHVHTTPSGGKQNFLYAHFTKVAKVAD